MNNKRNKAANISFGKKIAKLRKERKLSQFQLSADANIARSFLILIENGESNPTITTICALAEALEVKPKDLLDF